MRNPNQKHTLASTASGHGVEVAAYRTDEGDLAVWCDWCGVWHRHGGVDGHRVSHCRRPGGPYERGYWLRVVGPLTEEVRRAHRSGGRGR